MIDFIIFPILTVVIPEYKTLLYPSTEFPFILNNHSNNSVKLYNSLPIIEHLKVSDELFFTSPLNFSFDLFVSIVSASSKIGL